MNNFIPNIGNNIFDVRDSGLATRRIYSVKYRPVEKIFQKRKTDNNQDYFADKSPVCLHIINNSKETVNMQVQRISMAFLTREIDSSFPSTAMSVNGSGDFSSPDRA